MVYRKARCGWAAHKQTAQSLDRAATSRSDPQNCNVYIGNVSQEVTDAQLRQSFEPFGTITDVKIYRKGMDSSISAEQAKYMCCIWVLTK